MKEDSKLNEIKQVVDLISVVPLDFKDDNGNLICGYKFHYYTDVADSEKDKKQKLFTYNSNHHLLIKVEKCYTLF